MILNRLVGRLLIAIVGLGLAPLMSQDIIYPHFQSSSILSNPAFAGSHTKVHVNAGFRAQKVPSGISRGAVVPRVGSYLTVDGYANPVKLGIGYVGAFEQSHHYDRFSHSIVVSKKYLGKKWIFSPAIKGSYYDARLVYADSVYTDLVEDSTRVNGEAIDRLQFGDMGIGFLANSKNFLIGFSADHLLRPNHSFIKGDNGWRLPFRLGLQLRYKQSLNEASKLALYHTLFLNSQNSINSLCWVTELIKGPMKIGIAYMHKNYIAVLAGMKLGKFAIGVDYDVHVEWFSLSENERRHAVIEAMGVTARYKF